MALYGNSKIPTTSTHKAMRMSLLALLVVVFLAQDFQMHVQFNHINAQRIDQGLCISDDRADLFISLGNFRWQYLSLSFLSALFNFNW